MLLYSLMQTNYLNLIGSIHCFDRANFTSVNTSPSLPHCVKSVRIRRFSGPHFPAFGMNTERYSISFRIQTYYFLAIVRWFSLFGFEWKINQRSVMLGMI